MSIIQRGYTHFIPRRRMASLWFYVSSVMVISVATFASPIELLDREKRSSEEDITTTGVPATNLTTNPLYGIDGRTTLLRYITEAIEELEEMEKTGTLDQQTTDGIENMGAHAQEWSNGTGTLGLLDEKMTELISRNTRAARSRSRSRTSGSRTTKRTGGGTTTVNQGSSRQGGTTGESPPRTPPGSSRSRDRMSNPTRRGGGSTTSSRDHCASQDCNDAPTLADTIRTHLRELYDIVSDILGDEFSRPRHVSDSNLIVLLNFVDTHGGEAGKRFVARIGRTHRTRRDQWEQCCQLYVVGRRRKRSTLADHEQVDLMELILALLDYDIPR